MLTNKKKGQNAMIASFQQTNWPLVQMYDKDFFFFFDK